MSSIRKRSGSKFYWYSTGSPPNRIERSTKQTNHHAARVKQKEFDSIYERLHTFQAPKTVSLFIDSYVQWHYGTHKKAWSERVEHGLKPFKSKYGSLPLDFIEIEHLQAYKEERLKGGYAGNTVNNELSILTGMFKYAIMRRAIMSNPADAYFISRIDTTDNRRKPIAIAITKEIIDTEINLKDKAMYALAVFAGMRSGDAGTLTKDNIQNDSLEWDQGKVGRKCVVPMHPILKTMDLCELYVTKSQRRSVTLRLQKRLKEYNVKADFHSLRHTFGQRLEESGADHLEIKFLMGHRIDDITWRYIHKNVEKLRPYINRI